MRRSFKSIAFVKLVTRIGGPQFESVKTKSKCWFVHRPKCFQFTQLSDINSAAVRSMLYTHTMRNNVDWTAFRIQVYGYPIHSIQSSQQQFNQTWDQINTHTHSHAYCYWLIFTDILISSYTNIYVSSMNFLTLSFSLGNRFCYHIIKWRKENIETHLNEYQLHTSICDMWFL